MTDYILSTFGILIYVIYAIQDTRVTPNRHKMVLPRYILTLSHRMFRQHIESDVNDIL